jgi:diaminobutyrate-2-oxoglutarate transaminase
MAHDRNFTRVVEQFELQFSVYCADRKTLFTQTPLWGYYGVQLSSPIKKVVILEVNITASTSTSSTAIPAVPEIPSVYERRESNVRSYCRSFPTEFTTAVGCTLTDATGRHYLDFFAGAGALNYGHNHPRLKQALVDYVMSDGLTHGLDLHTAAKTAFLQEFEARLLKPRHLPYKVQFTGPTGANAVEAAFKIARKATGRTGIFSYMGGYHGHSLGGLAATANREHRAGAGVSLHDTTFLPFPADSSSNLNSTGIDTHAYLRMILSDGHSGIEVPAAIVVETVQAEGGIMIASVEWLQELRAICDEYNIVLIVDEIQTGCGRTGPFFSFERAGIVPDIVTVSKSISGLGMPMSLVLLKPELDVWKPAEHTGTFRGNQLAFVTATEALKIFDEEEFATKTAANSAQIASTLEAIVATIDERITFRGEGMIWGIDLSGIDPTGAFAKAVSRGCFDDQLIIERVGRNDTVLKVLPPLTISPEELDNGLNLIAGAIKRCLDIL